MAGQPPSPCACINTSAGADLEPSQGTEETGIRSGGGVRRCTLGVVLDPLRWSGHFQEPPATFPSSPGPLPHRQVLFSGFEMNFIKSRSSNMLVPYDYSSVMHYGLTPPPASQRKGPRSVSDAPAPGRRVPSLGGGQMTRALGHRFCRPLGSSNQLETGPGCRQGSRLQKGPALRAQGY